MLGVCPPDPEFSHPAAVASTPDVSQESVTDPPSRTPTTITPANGCTAPILPWTPDQARPTTPPVVCRNQEVAYPKSPYQPMLLTEFYTLPELVIDRGRATRLGVHYDQLSPVPHDILRTALVTGCGVN